MVHFWGLYQAETSHPCFPIPYLLPLSAQVAGFCSSCEISRLPFLHRGNVRIRMQDLSSALEKKGPWLLVPQLKMSSWPCNKSHGVVMCLLITVRCLAVIHTLIYSLGPLHAPQTHFHFCLSLSSFFIFFTSPFLFFCLFHSLCINPCIHKGVVYIIYEKKFCVKKVNFRTHCQTIHVKLVSFSATTSQ